jgi:hypothetical protein
MQASVLTPSEEGGFRLEVPGEDEVSAIPAEHGWRVEGPAGPGMRFLTAETGDGSAGLVLRAGQEAGSEERGRTTLLSGPGGGGSDASLLLDDGRLFRIFARRGREAGFELSGWEIDAAYMIAEPRGGQWLIRQTEAGCELEDEGAIALLFAAHLAGLP